MPKNKIHVQYKTKSGTLVPGVTTVLSLLDKPAIHHWIAKVTREGLDWTKVRDESAGIGTLTHYLILCDLKHEKPDVSEYSEKDQEAAQNALKSYYAWHKANDVIPLSVEESLVSEKWGYGGTYDLFASVNGFATVIDFKTSGGIYDEYLTQLAAYGELIREYKGEIVQGKIVRINKANNDDFEVRTAEQMEKRFELFRHLLRVYTLQKELT